MTQKSLIMIVDDEPANCKLLEQALSINYLTITCVSGEECLAQLENCQPELILLDVMMPGLNGHEVCTRIKENHQTENIPVIFISALDTLDDRVKGYDSGGDDYLGKPVDLSILLSKIKLLLTNKEKEVQLQKDVKEIQSGLMTALTMGAESGQVTNFIEQSLHAKNYDQLLHVFFESMQSFNLNCVAQIRSGEEIITINSKFESKPLEHELMLNAQAEGRIIQFGSRMFINYPNFSLLIKNTPVDDPDLVGRLRDHLAVIANACDSRVQNISTERNLQSQLDVTALFKEMTSSIELINKKLEIDSKKAVEISQSMGQKIENKLIFLGLDEDQEIDLMAIIDSSTLDLTKLMDKQSTIKEALEYITFQMNQALSKI